MKQKLIMAIAAVVAFFMLLGWVGGYDHAEQVILQMSQEEYDNICAKLTEQNGSHPSDREIADYYIDNK